VDPLDVIAAARCAPPLGSVDRDPPRRPKSAARPSPLTAGDYTTVTNLSTVLGFACK
jgi:hypothetical protein